MLKPASAIRLLLFLLLLAATLAASPAAAKGLEGLRIAVVSFNTALNKSEAGERSKSILLSAKSQMENELKAKETELKKKREDLQNNIMLTAAAREAREKELRESELDLRKAVQEATRDLQDRERKLTESIVVELRTVIEAVAKEEKYDLVLEESAAKVVLFSTAKMDDITDKVIERYNKFSTGR